MRKTYFLINPDAGKGEGLNLLSWIDALWRQAEIKYETYVTNSHVDIAVGVKKAIEDNATEIVVAGGDGTILAVVNALNGSALPIGVIPCGTGNDFARSNGISLRIDEALQTVLKMEKLTAVDIGNCNGLFFLNVASVGIDAAIVKRTQKVKKWFSGSVAYLIASIIEIFMYSPMSIFITIDGKTISRNVELVAIANGRFYGGGMKIAPEADTSDGIYDLVLISKIRRRRLLRLLPTLYSGTHVLEPEVELFKGENIQISLPEKMDINLDGELIQGSDVVITKINTKIYIIGYT